LAAVAGGQAEVVEDRCDVGELVVDVQRRGLGGERAEYERAVDVGEQEVWAVFACELVGVFGEGAVWDAYAALRSTRWQKDNVQRFPANPGTGLPRWCFRAC